MVLYFSGTGNSAYVAKQLGQMLQDEVLDLFERLREGDSSSLASEQPWVLVVPTYAWQIPRVVRDWLKRTTLHGSREIYFVLTCGGSVGNAGAYCGKLCRAKGMEYRGCMEIVMPENYIAMFTAPQKEEAIDIIRKSGSVISQTAQYIKERKAFPERRLSLADRLNSSFVNMVFYPALVHADKFYVTEKCISCGKCEIVCPLKNVRLDDGKPVWGKQCTHCMACICRCPAEAIEYGKHTKGLVRYTCPE